MLYYGMVWYGDVAGEGCGVSCRAFFLSSVFFFGGYANLAVADEVVGMYVFIHLFGALGAGSCQWNRIFFGIKKQLRSTWSMYKRLMPICHRPN